MAKKRETQNAIVTAKEDEGNRVLLIPEQRPSRLERYVIIASPKAAADIHVGDNVTYEPCGVNFGWFVSKAQRNSV